MEDQELRLKLLAFIIIRSTHVYGERGRERGGIK